MSAQFHQEDEFRDKLDTGLWLKLLRRALQRRGFIAALVACAVLVAMCDASFALVTRWVINGVVKQGAGAAFGRYARFARDVGGGRFWLYGRFAGHGLYLEVRD